MVNQFSVEIFEKNPGPECGKVIQTTKMLTEHMKRSLDLMTKMELECDISSIPI